MPTPRIEELKTGVYPDHAIRQQACRRTPRRALQPDLEHRAQRPGLEAQTHRASPALAEHRVRDAVPGERSHPITAQD